MWLMGVDHRRYSRKALAVDFAGRDGSGTGLLIFTSADVSAGGAFLKSELLLEQGETLSLEFHLEGRREPIRARANVVWVRRFPEPNQPAGMGVEFVSINDEDRAALSALVDGGP
jgi:uncharacterized protein (TIGR02266 family)